jgi:hypothetical protein
MQYCEYELSIGKTYTNVCPLVALQEVICDLLFCHITLLILLFYSHTWKFDHAC